MVVKLLSLRGFAKRSGLAYGTVNRYHYEGRLPPHDGEIGEDENDPKARYGWLPETVDNWRRRETQTASEGGAR